MNVYQGHLVPATDYLRCFVKPSDLPDPVAMDLPACGLRFPDPPINQASAHDDLVVAPAALQTPAWRRPWRGLPLMLAHLRELAMHLGVLLYLPLVVPGDSKAVAPELDCCCHQQYAPIQPV